MKLYLFLCPALAAVLFLCVVPAVATEPTVPQALTLFVDAPEKTSRKVLEHMRGEIESLLGLPVRRAAWKRGDPRGLQPAAGASVWLTLQGPCRACGREICGKQYGPMGRTWSANGRIQPWIEVECDLVRRLIHQRVRAAGMRRSEELLGKALGRVVAHELYHVYMNTPHHAEETLTRPFFTSDDLTRNAVAFSEVCRRRIQAAVCGSAPPSGE